MKILIVEDDPFVANDIKERLEHLGFRISGMADSYESALEEIEKTVPDVALLDIELKGMLTGLDLGKRLSQMGINHIYLTGIQDNVTFMRTRETSPLRNIPKPVTTVSLRNALDIDLNKLPEPTKIRVVNDNGKKVRIDPESILYANADGSYCKVVCKKEDFTLSMNLKTFLEYMDWPQLVRTSRSSAININSFNSLDGNRIELKNGKIINLDPKYREMFLHYLKQN